MALIAIAAVAARNAAENLRRGLLILFPPKYEACLVPVCVHVRFAADCKAVTGRLGVAPASTIASTSGAILVRVSSRSTASTTCRGSLPLNCSSLETAISLQLDSRGG